MYEIFVETHFSAAHHLRGYDGDCGKLHGHNWVVEVHIQCKKLNDIGIGVDFRDVKQAVKNILSRLDHTDLYCRFRSETDRLSNYVRVPPVH